MPCRNRQTVRRTSPKCRRSAHAIRRPPAQARGRFFNTGNAFNVQLPPVPDHLFTAEPDAALDPAAPTGLIACDLSQQLDCPFPATTPLVLARYARIRAGEILDTEFAASGIICYVIRGSGSTDRRHAKQIAWSAGDLFILPGGPSLHSFGQQLMQCCGSSPTSRNSRSSICVPPGDGNAPTAIVHFTAAEIAASDRLHLRNRPHRGNRRFGTDLFRPRGRKPAATSCPR